MPLPFWFYSVRRATPEEDRRGIDMYVDSDIGPIPVQIKSSVEGMLKFRREHKGQEIAVVVVRDDHTLEDIRERAAEFIAEQRLRIIWAR